MKYFRATMLPMSLSQKVALNTFVQIVSKATTVIFGLLTTILLTGYLGREGYGDYMYIITLIVLFGVFADWGTATIGVREAAKTKIDQGRALANIFILRLGLAFFGAALMTLAALFLPIQSANELLVRRGIVIGALILILFATKASFGIVFQTKMEMQKLAVADIAGSILTFLLSWFFIRQAWSLLTLVGAVVIAGSASVVIAGQLAVKTIKFDFRFSRSFIRKLVVESLPMGAILLVFTVDNKIDTVILGSLKGSGAVGVYAVAYRVYDVLILGAAFLMNALLPVISRYAAKNKYKKELRRIYQSVFDVLFVMGAGALLTTLVMAPLIIRLLTQQRFGEFADSVLVLRILAVALFLAYFNHLTGYTIVALGKQRSYFLVALAALSFNITANLVMIPSWSYRGAAIVTVVTEGLVLFITSYFIFRLLGIAPSLAVFPKTIVQLIKNKGKIF